MNEFFANFHFLRPLWLIAAPVSVAGWWLMQRVSDPRREFESQFAPHLLDAMIVEPKRRPLVRPPTVLLAVWLVGVLVLAGPSWRREPEPFAEDQAGLYIVARLGESMNLEDVSPSRLERSRNKIQDLMKLRDGGRTGLIAYSGSAHLVMPLTTDPTVIEHMFESLSPEVMPSEGDALAKALQLASNRIRESNSPASILLIADAAAPDQLEQLRQWRTDHAYTVQILTPILDQPTLDASGLVEAADALKARLRLITADEADVTSIQRTATSSLAAVAAGEGERWRDEGWILTPLLALAAMLWGRRGWSVVLS